MAYLGPQCTTGFYVQKENIRAAQQYKQLTGQAAASQKGRLLQRMETVCECPMQVLSQLYTPFHTFPDMIPSMNKSPYAKSRNESSFRLFV
ncbi:MAG: hypothetical protein IJ242_17865 [Clostridia bacterium]|nr:hypothetical protein [Clostridia bacterium]